MVLRIQEHLFCFALFCLSKIKRESFRMKKLFWANESSCIIFSHVTQSTSTTNSVTSVWTIRNAMKTASKREWLIAQVTEIYKLMIYSCSFISCFVLYFFSLRQSLSHSLSQDFISFLSTNCFIYIPFLAVQVLTAHQVTCLFVRPISIIYSQSVESIALNEMETICIFHSHRIGGHGVAGIKHLSVYHQHSITKANTMSSPD